MNKIIPGVFALILLFGCGGEENAAQKQFEVAKTKVEHVKLSDEDNELRDEIIEGLPNPIEMASIIQEVGAKILQEDLIHRKPDELTSNTEKAIFFGGYAIDFASLSLNGLSKTSLEYMTHITTLSKELDVDQFFDYEILKNYSNDHKVDSLIDLTTKSLEDMSNFLNEKQRSQLNIAILVGGWTEALYLSTVYSERANDNDKLKSFICQQGETVMDIVDILVLYEHSVVFNKIQQQLAPVSEAYKKVNEITSGTGETTYIEIDGELMAQQDLSVTYEISDEDYNHLLTTLKTFRYEIIK